MPEIIDNGANPLIVVSEEEVTAWLRSIADNHGFADRATCTVQTTCRNLGKGAEDAFYYCPPELVLMVSNIKDSRHPHETEE